MSVFRSPGGEDRTGEPSRFQIKRAFPVPCLSRGRPRAIPIPPFPPSPDHYSPALAAADPTTSAVTSEMRVAVVARRVIAEGRGRGSEKKGLEKGMAPRGASLPFSRQGRARAKEGALEGDQECLVQKSGGDGRLQRAMWKSECRHVVPPSRAPSPHSLLSLPFIPRPLLSSFNIVYPSGPFHHQARDQQKNIKPRPLQGRGG
jgi:hypothetical protein